MSIVHDIIWNASNEFKYEFNIEETAIKEACMENSFSEGNDHTINVEGKNHHIDKLS